MAAVHTHQIAGSDLTYTFPKKEIAHERTWRQLKAHPVVLILYLSAIATVIALLVKMNWPLQTKVIIGCSAVGVHIACGTIVCCLKRRYDNTVKQQQTAMDRHHLICGIGNSIRDHLILSEIKYLFIYHKCTDGDGKRSDTESLQYSNEGGKGMSATTFEMMIYSVLTGTQHVTKVPLRMEFRALAIYPDGSAAFVFFRKSLPPTADGYDLLESFDYIDLKTISEDKKDSFDLLLQHCRTIDAQRERVPKREVQLRHDRVRRDHLENEIVMQLKGHLPRGCTKALFYFAFGHQADVKTRTFMMELNKDRMTSHDLERFLTDSLSKCDAVGHPLYFETVLIFYKNDDEIISILNLRRSTPKDESFDAIKSDFNDTGTAFKNAKLLMVDMSDEK